MAKYDEYESPLAHRYASYEIKKIFSPRERASTWRKLWLWLHEAVKELDLTQITDKAIEANWSNLIVSDEAFQVIAAEERVRRHDVMSAIFALEKDAPDAAGIIHIGATSCYELNYDPSTSSFLFFSQALIADGDSNRVSKVTDNADLIFMRDALGLILPKLAKVIHNLSQPRNLFLYSVGRRAAQWAQDLVMDLDDIEYASFMEIFHGDTSKIDRLNEILCEKAGFEACYDISTQTYSRKVDLSIANTLSAFGASAIRIATDIRHLAHDKVLDEPHEATQTGSSAMSYRMNPMRSERICSLGRKLSNISTNFSDTFSNQWLERTLDDSAIRRIDIPEMFLLTDALLILLDDITNGLVVFPAMVRSQIEQEIPFIATENIIMKLVPRGVSRQEAHERIRVLSLETIYAVKMEGGKNNLIERIKKDVFFKPIWDELDCLLDHKLFIGRSGEIFERYFGTDGPVTGKLEKYRDFAAFTATATLPV
ncbi:adenylosuccinase ade13 [Mycoblastus sanguinarius]|nr:adenylosuccinase ade13 [Mycoblastus sanguinarius]